MRSKTIPNQMVLHVLNCCGVKEIGGISYYSKPQDALYDFIIALRAGNRMYNYTEEPQDFLRSAHCGVLLFTGAGYGSEPPEYSEAFKTYIEKEGLGDVDCQFPFVNPNTSRNIFLYIWRVDHQALAKWWQREVREFEGVKPEVTSVPSSVDTSNSISY